MERSQGEAGIGPPSGGWRTFLHNRNHAPDTTAVELWERLALAELESYFRRLAARNTFASNKRRWPERRESVPVKFGARTTTELGPFDARNSAAT
jgi:hypothetical protein